MSCEFNDLGSRGARDPVALETDPLHSRSGGTGDRSPLEIPWHWRQVPTGERPPPLETAQLLLQAAGEHLVTPLPVVSVLEGGYGRWDEATQVRWSKVGS